MEQEPSRSPDRMDSVLGYQPCLLVVDSPPTPGYMFGLLALQLVRASLEMETRNPLEGVDLKEVMTMHQELHFGVDQGLDEMGKGRNTQEASEEPGSFGFVAVVLRPVELIRPQLAPLEGSLHLKVDAAKDAL